MSFLGVSFAGRSWHPVGLLSVLALWLTVAGNLPLWVALWRLPEMQGGRALLGGIGLGAVLFGVVLFTLGVTLWGRWFKPVGVLLLITVTASSYFMASYGVVIDSSMIANAANTDVREVRDLLSPMMLPALFLGAVVPGVWWWRQRVRPQGVRRRLLSQLGAAVLGLALAAMALFLVFQDLASLMRNHKPLRYMINPYNTVYALGRYGIGQSRKVQQPLLTLGEDAHLVVSATHPAQAPLIVLVLGETARAANFGLGGYGRDTTPGLQALHARGELVYFSQVRSCGTSTEASVPCLFSHLGREAYASSELRYENLLDVLQRAGLAVLWLDNQSGCKGVCDRVPHADTHGLKVPGLCDGGECQDAVMLHELPRHLAALDAERRARGTVVVMHQMGSHGPAYFKRSQAKHKAFMPECSSNTLQNCSREEVVNAYDNSLRETDAFLTDTIAWLQEQDRPTAVLYVSDHGESLGEKGLYLHGMPYAFAPDEQTHVPMLLWLSDGMRKFLQLDLACLGEASGRAWSHDNIFPTMLDLSQVRTAAADRNASVLSKCTASRTAS